MEDAFSFASAKSAHAHLLQCMEQNRYSWLDVDQLDRCRSSHAQRHLPLEPSHDTVQDLKNDHMEPKNIKAIPCKFFANETCRSKKTHFKNGVWYIHACRKCGGNHFTSTCTSKTKNW